MNSNATARPSRIPSLSGREYLKRIIFEYARMSVRHVARRARVSQLMFHEYFDDLEECVLAAFEDALGRIVAVVCSAADA